jgi:proteic killer suppression protein
MSIKRDDLDAGRVGARCQAEARSRQCGKPAEELTIPPSNRLEKLKGGLKDFHSIRINDQWRVIFKWIDGEPYEVRIADYH